MAAYNREKDRATIEKTFADLMDFMATLDEEEQRAMREGLEEETLALFDLLVKPDLNKKEIERIKKVAQELLAKLKDEKLHIDNWREKQATRDAVRVAIHDFLYSDATGLPADAYSEDDVEIKTERVYQHVFLQYASMRQAVLSSGPIR